MREHKLRTAYSTDSAGMHPNHTLPLKLRAIAEAGFSDAELAFPDLEAYASQEYPGYRQLDRAGKGDMDTLCKAAGKIRKLCDELDLGILAVHPFDNYEGFKEKAKIDERLERAAAWFKVMKVLECEMLQVGSSIDPTSSGDFDIIASNFQQLADEAAAQIPPIRIAYENWAWGVHVNTWEHIWDICERVDRSNFGLCLDTFHICAREYASPTSPTSALRSNAASTLQASLQKLMDIVPAHAIFYVQISDASKNVSPDRLEAEAKKKGIDVLYAYSQSWRPLPYMDEVAETKDGGYGGFFPVVDVLKAILKTGFEGPWSYEVRRCPSSASVHEE